MAPRLIILISFVFLLSTQVFAGESVPTWLRQAASVAVPSYEKDVPAVVLHDEQQVTLGTDGKLVTTQNYAVKLLNREGKSSAIARAFYLVSSGKVREIEGWLIRADGTTKNYDKKTILDIIADPDDVYNEGRIKVIDASEDTDVGFTFGYTVVSEDTPLFYQDVWSFQGRLPTITSRYTLNLPSGWKASSVTFNAAEVKPVVSGTSYTWEMRNLAPIPPEPLSPSVVNLAPRIAVNYSPENNSQAVNRAFADWADVSRWGTALHDPQVVVDDAVAAKARELTANAKTELEKIHAIGSYVQNLQYISIDIGVGHGNGYKPRSSTLVLSRGYGDCKDKANLMRAMLKTLKIEAYPIFIYSGDPSYVRAEWSSPSQFNHCIIAVKVSDETKSPTVITDAKLGRLLIFDATDSFTPVGDLPDYLQGSLALIAAGDHGSLAKMPVTPPDTDLLERNIEVSISDAGSIKGKISERANGQVSTSFRREMRELSASDYKKAIEGWLTRGATGAQLINVSSKDRHSEAGFDLDVEFAAPAYGQLMQNRLLVFKPVIVGRRNSVVLTEPKRKNPIELTSNAMKETVVFNLPQGFVVDEMPDPVSLETPFGKYSTKYEMKDGKLIFSRVYTTNRANIPVEKYGSVKDFYSKILAAEQSPVVLLKK
jgi:transglutaminase-like putative cysteine protease